MMVACCMYVQRWGAHAADLINTFQYPWDARVPKPEMCAKRAKVIHKPLPRRNLLLTGGDMNLQLPPRGSHVGTAVQIKLRLMSIA